VCTLHPHTPIALPPSPSKYFCAGALVSVRVCVPPLRTVRTSLLHCCARTTRSYPSLTRFVDFHQWQIQLGRARACCVCCMLTRFSTNSLRITQVHEMDGIYSHELRQWRTQDITYRLPQNCAQSGVLRSSRVYACKILADPLCSWELMPGMNVTMCCRSW